MYILSNGVKITKKTYQEMCWAIKDTSKKYVYFLDMKTGKLIRILRNSRQKLVSIRKKPQSFIPLPKVSENERRKRFVAFVEELGIIDVPELQEHLSKEIKKGSSLKKLERILKNDPSGWIHGWVQNEQFLLAERIEEWITVPPLSAKKETFKKTQKQRAWMGGKLIEEPDVKKEKGTMKEKKFKHIGTTDNFKMPKWMECTWRRVPCGRDDCPICGRIKKDRQRHIERGEDPDDIQSIFEDVGRNLKETFEMIKRDSQRMSIDITNLENIQEPPEPEEFPFYQKVEKWNKEIFKIADEAELSGDWWINTEAAADLFWYANTLLVKVYRQLCNRWHIDNGDDYGDFDYQYTKYVIGECLKILKKSLKELISFDSTQKINLILVHDQMINLEEKIFKI